MTTPIDVFRPDLQANACDSRIQCCPDAPDEDAGAAPLDAFLPGAAVAVAMGVKDMGVSLREAIMFLAERSRRLGAQRWLDELPEADYLRLVRLVSTRMEEVSAFRLLSADARTDLVINIIVTVVMSAEGDPSFSELSPDKQEIIRRLSVERLAGMLVFERFRTEALTKDGHLTKAGADKVRRQMAPITPAYPPAGKGFDPYLPLDPHLEPTAEALARVLEMTDGPGRDDPPEAHRRAVWAVLEAHRILEAQEWFARLSVGAKERRAHELNQRLVAELSSPALLKAVLNSDGYVKIGALRALVMRMDQPAFPEGEQAFGTGRAADRGKAEAQGRRFMDLLRSKVRFK